MAPDELPEPLDVALDVTRILGRLGVPYIVAGSFASSVHGEPRTTNDIDLVADLRPVHAGALLEALAGDYYVDADVVREAIAGGGSFNAIHLAGAVKVDVFVVGGDPFDAERVARGREVLLDAPDRMLRVDLPEFTIVRKLEWYRRGGETSERQWRDVLGILRAQQGRLDLATIRAWSDRLRVRDLVERAIGATTEAQR